MINDIGLLDYFAGQALSSLATKRIPIGRPAQELTRTNELAELARDAYEIAAAMVKRRSELVAAGAIEKD